MDIWHERLLHSHMTHPGLLLREQLNRALGLFLLPEFEVNHKIPKSLGVGQIFGAVPQCLSVLSLVGIRSGPWPNMLGLPVSSLMLWERTSPLHRLSGGCPVGLRREPGSSHDLMMKLLGNGNGQTTFFRTY